MSGLRGVVNDRNRQAGRRPSERNVSIVEARASGRPLQAIALEHGLSVARVSRIVQDHRKDLRIAELEAEVARLGRELTRWEGHAREAVHRGHLRGESLRAVREAIVSRDFAR